MQEIAPAPAAPPSPAEAGPGLREAVALACKLRARLLWLFLAPVCLALLLLALLPRTYRAESDILVKTGREYLAQVEGDSGMSAPASTKQEEVESELALLTSRAVAEATIRSVGLARIYPALGKSGISPGALIGRLFKPADPEAARAWLMDEAVRHFARDLGAQPVKLSNVISVTFTGQSPRQAEMVLNAAIAAYIEKHRQVFTASHTAGYQDAIDHALSDIGALEQQRTKIKLESGIYDIAAQRAALIAQRVDAEGHVQDAINSQASLQQRLAYLTQARPSIAGDSHATGNDVSDEILHAREALTDLTQAEAAMSARFGDGNPDLQRIRAQIQSLRQTIAATRDSRESLATTQSTLVQQIDQEIVMSRAELAPLAAEIDRTRALIGRIGGELYRLERADLDLRTIATRLDALNANLKTLQEHYDQARTQEQTDLARQASVVQVAPAIAAQKPVSPKKLMVLAGGLLLGAIAASGMIVFELLTNRTVLTSEALARVSGLPVLASIAYAPPARMSRRGGWG